MNPQPKSDWERRLEELEQEVEKESSPSSVRPLTPAENLENSLDRLRNWFDGLPTIAKVGVGIVAVMVAFSLLNTVLRVVASLLTVAILAGVLYVMYKFFIAANSSKDP